jgi:FkbM family methyltransferase
VHALIKSMLKGIIPPALVHLMKPGTRHLDPWGQARFGMSGLRLPGGKRFSFRPTLEDRQVCEQIFFNRDYATDQLQRSADIQKYYQSCESPIIVDAGANIGAASVWFALTYPKATILALEPERANFEVLQANSAAFPSVVPINGAISATNGSLYLSDPGAGAWGFRTTNEPDERSYRVDALTLEDLLAKATGTPFILKIDIEGAESDLFSRPPAVLDRFPLLIIELHDWLLPGKCSSRNFLKWHAQTDRDFVHFGENVFSIANGASFS